MKRLFLMIAILIYFPHGSLCAMEEVILPKNPANVQLLKQKIKKYLEESKTGKYGSIHNFSRCFHSLPTLKKKQLYNNLVRYCNEESEDGSPVLINTVSRGHVEEVEIVLLAGADPNVQYRGMTPLSVACAQNKPNTKIIKLLLDAGAKVNCIYPLHGGTLLHEVVGKNSEVASMLFDAGVNPEIKNDDDKTYLELMELQQIENDAIWADFLNKKVILKQKVQEYIKKGRPYFRTLQESIQFPRETVDSIYEHLVKYCNTPDGENKYPIYSAASSANWKVIELLLLAGADPNCGMLPNVNYDSPFYMAVDFRDIQSAILLLKYHANVNQQDRNGQSPLYRAVFNGDLQMVLFLLEAGASVDYRDPDTGETLLHVACNKKHLTVAKMLHEAGVDATVRDKKGRTALEIAHEGLPFYGPCFPGVNTDLMDAVRDWTLKDVERKFESRNECQRLLTLRQKIQKYLDLGSPDFIHLQLFLKYPKKNVDSIYKHLLVYGNTPMKDSILEKTTLPIYKAINSCNVHVVELLLLAGADVEGRTANGEYQCLNSPLYEALFKDDLELVTLLLKYQANPNRKGGESRTPLHIAAYLSSNGAFMSNEIAKVLLEYGADKTLKDDDGRTPYQFACHMYADSSFIKLIK